MTASRLSRAGHIQRTVRSRAGRRSVAIGAAALCVLSVVVVQAQAIPSTFLELDGNVVSDSTGTYDWSNNGTLATSANGTVTRDGTGGLFDGGKFNGATTPPTAPALTTAAAADASIADAQFKVDPLSVDSTSCGTGDPTAYTGAGSETNGGLLSADTFGTSSVPNKDDLSNVYAAAHIASGVNEVFFGAERVINNGDSHIDFEFLQSSVTIPNACSGTFSGNRTQGDFLLSVDFSSGGTLGTPILYKWICDKTFNAAHNNTVCNPPAHGQSVPHYEATGSTAIKLKVNDPVTAIGCGGWACRNSDGTQATTIAQNELMEGGINLTELGFTGCVSTFLPHTRSSQSFTAVLKDFEVIPFNTCAHPTITTAIANASGTPLTLDSNGVAHVSLGTVLRDTSTLHGTAGTPTGTVTYTLYTAADCGGTATDLTPTPNALVAGAPPNSNTFTFNDAGTYYFKAAAAFTDSLNLGTPNSGCNAEPVVVAPATPAPHSTPVVQIKDTLTVTGFSPNATGSVLVGLYTDSGCTTRAAGTSDASFTVAEATAGAATTFVTVTAGSYYYKISYATDGNNTGFSDCTESVGVTITSLA
jgi:hypothetical protein